MLTFYNHKIVSYFIKMLCNQQKVVDISKVKEKLYIV